MNPLAMIRGLVEGFQEGQRVQAFGPGYRQKLAAADLENQKNQLEVADLPTKLEQARKLNQIPIDTDAEQHAALLADVVSSGGQGTPEGVAAFQATQAKHKRDVADAEVNAKIASENAAVEASKKNQPDYAPQLSDEALNFLGVAQGGAAGPAPLPSNATIGVLEKKRAEEASVKAAQAMAASRLEVARSHGGQPKLTKMIDPNNPNKTIMAWVTPGQDPVRIGDAPLNATTASRADAAQAIVSQAEDIKNQLRDPKVAATLGPVLGRYNNLTEFIGNPPPEFARLAGDIESFGLANMGVHGMRSTQGAQILVKMMSGKHTPESLIAALDGLTNYAHRYLGVTREGAFGADTPAGMHGGAAAANTVATTPDNSIEAIKKKHGITY